jgi:hypothetical protein
MSHAEATSAALANAVRVVVKHENVVEDTVLYGLVGSYFVMTTSLMIGLEFRVGETNVKIDNLSAEIKGSMVELRDKIRGLDKKFDCLDKKIDTQGERLMWAVIVSAVIGPAVNLYFRK